MKPFTAAFLAGALLVQTAAPQVPPWPADNRPPSNLDGDYVFLDSRDEHNRRDRNSGTSQGPATEAAEIIRLPYRNRFDPEVSVSLSRAVPDRYRYVYSLANGKTGKDGVHGWTIATSCGGQVSIETRPLGWHCTPIEQAMAVHQFALPYLMQKGCSAVCFVDGEQPTGSRVSQVEIVSGLRPGFSTASAENYPPFKVSEDWPEVIRESPSLIELGSPARANQHTVTIGPRFGPGVSRPDVAEDCLKGLAELVRTGKSSPRAPDFVGRTRTTLTQAAESGRFDVRTIGVPSTALESEIVVALTLSFENGGH